MSVSEKVFWGYIRKGKVGFKFRRQAPVLGFILDFYCPEANVCVEIDGEQHLEQVEYDRYRDNELAQAGIITIRIPSLDIFEQSPKLGQWINLINRVCSERTGKESARIY